MEGETNWINSDRMRSSLETRSVTTIFGEVLIQINKLVPGRDNWLLEGICWISLTNNFKNATKSEKGTR